jgi:hypothetical protein
VHAKSLAVFVSAVLGIAAGVLGSFLLPDSGGTVADPLHLGVAMKNLGCTGDSLVLLGSGATKPGLSSAIQANAGSTVHYLQPSASCPTAWKYQPANETHVLPDPEYIAYLGPYSSTYDACAVRMSADHKGDFVTTLTSGLTDMVQCACYYDVQKMPQLVPGMTNDVVDSIWIRQLQEMLLDLGDLPKNARLDGFYSVGSPTVRAVENQQRAKSLNPYGVVDAGTWRLITRPACATYTS